MSMFKNVPNKSIIVDGDEKWLSRSTAVVVTIILNGEKVLLIKRGKNCTQSGKWCNPCGYIDWNESGTKCCIREVWEETGLDINKIIEDPDNIDFDSLIYPWDIVTNPELNHNQDIALYYGLCFSSENIPELTIDNSEGESADVRWVNIEDLKNYEFSFNHDKRIYKYINYIKEKSESYN
jgi:8-oxo-dGTP pyrophosphatase MutT (NUDIX family)